MRHKDRINWVEEWRMAVSTVTAYGKLVDTSHVMWEQQMCTQSVYHMTFGKVCGYNV